MMFKRTRKSGVALLAGLMLTGALISGCHKKESKTSAGSGISSQSVVTVKGASS